MCRHTDHDRIAIAVLAVPARRVAAVLVLVALAATGLLAAPVAAVADVPATHIRGADRYGTAIQVSQAAYPLGSDAVVLVNGLAWADALGGSALAGASDGPILLTTKDSIPGAVRTELSRLAPSRVYLLGGEAALTSDIESQLRSELGTGTTIVRLAGRDRYVVAQAAARETMQAAGTSQTTAFVATGYVFADALSCAPIAAAEGWPIYLAHPERSPAQLIAEMSDAGITRVVIAGGTAAVPASVEDALEDEFGAASISRLAGSDRYKTALAVSSFAAAEAGFDRDEPGFASGEAYADALSGGVYLGMQRSPLLLLSAGRVPDSVASALYARRATMGRYTFLGGPAVVPWHVRNECQHALRAPYFSKSRAQEHVYAITALGVREAGSAAERRAADYVADELRSYGYTVSTQTFAIPYGKTSINVVATKTGTTSDTLVLGAHIDSKPPSPGANDNGSGVAVMLELARVLAASDVAPTVTFVAFGSEEICGPDPSDHHFGSTHYVAAMSAAQKAATEGMVSIDMVGYGDTFNVRNMGYAKMTVVASLREWGSYMDEPLYYLKDPGWSDHDSFEYAGIPAAWVEWRNDPVYHTARDTASHVQYDRVYRSGRLMRGWVLDLTEAEVEAFK